MNKQMLDVELKAKCPDLAKVRELLLKEGASAAGKEKQVDLYFKTKDGRLKFRRGTKQCFLIFYKRPNLPGIKINQFLLYHTSAPERLEQILTAAFEVLVTVTKEREVFYLRNIKFNLDRVEGLGEFIEIEAMAKSSEELQSLEKEVKAFAALFDIKKEEMQSHSYCELLLAIKKTTAKD